MARPKPNAPTVAKATMIFKEDTRAFENIFHFHKPTAWNVLELTQLATDLISWWNLNYKTAATADVSLTEVQTRKLDPADPLAADVPVTPPIQGTQPGQDVPADATMTMSWRTGKAGRRYRGRNYAVGLPELLRTTDDRMGSTYVNGLAGIAAALIHSILTAGELVVFHAPGDVPSTFDNTWDVVTTAVIENILDSQRRRLPGRGR